MKVYIMTDQEGVAGVINSVDFASPGARYYEVARELLTLEVNAAVEGVLEEGATDILVVDGHGHGSINPLLLHPQARLLAGRPMGYPFCCDSSFDCAIMIGQHSKANTDGGHLAHTGSFTVEELTINGISLGEAGCNMLFCGYFNVPMVMLSGDLAACMEVKALVPEMEVAPVKEGIKRGTGAGMTAETAVGYNGAAIHLHPIKARELIKETAKRAVRRRAEIKPFRLDPPYELVSITRRKQDGTPQMKAVVHSNDMIDLLNKPRRYQPISG
ncbi:MAG TPA: M55 family metallopeptidase [Firmicutes bacterium]|nr:M55 family metallopeptidase [Bacillota bacterium]